VTTTLTRTYTVILADDQPVVLGGLRAVLGGAVEVVAEAHSRDEVLREVSRHEPDVLVIDIGFDGNNGVATIQDVLAVAPDVTVLVFAASKEDGAVLAAIRAGARGYIYKAAEPADIVRAVLGVAAGEAIFGPGIVSCLRVELDRADRDHGLTTREREVLALMAAGHPNSQIARKLSLARKTISNHVSAIFAKLGVPDRSAAIVWAHDAGIR
jgi:DNA-binding NarL/FixJ family response regulator